ncbi:PREDICTED: C-X-C motif chemokine 16 isoform X2 [Condylura cristata]|uniref:C-X-C motif chemokine 16 isoform X2 n=1 Tax=Condylura cristata TaxID=143302 RepID=UPI000642C766|nr:PREDICTED: C-X-C motif chemokine 16 isoform X2 [Condylura cristata]
MWQVGAPQFRVLLLLLLALLTLPGYGNQGSGTGSCYCDKVISSTSPPADRLLKHFRTYLENYQRCFPVVRFQLRSRTPPQNRSVCGGRNDQWVLDLMSCFEKGECGLAHFGNTAHQKHLYPTRVQVPESTEKAPVNISSPVQTDLPSTLQLNLAGTPSLDEKLTYSSETISSTAEHSLEVKDKQIVPSAAGKTELVPVLSLLVIVFTLTSILLCVLCTRKQLSLQNFPGLQICYTPVAPYSYA